MIRCRIQHHPSRANLLPDLLARLAPLPTEIVPHDSFPPNPWQGYRRCLWNPGVCTHLLIVQDDTVPCPNFAAALEQIAAANPDTPVVLWLSNQPAGTAARARQAMIRNRRYVPFGFPPYIPVVALLWPRQVARDFLHWADHDPRSIDARADDGVVARYARASKQQFRVAVPSLVEHPDVAPTVKGGPQKAAAGKDKARVAMLLAEDALAYNW